MIAARRVRRGRPRLGTRGGKHLSPSVHRNSPSRSDWLPLDMRTTPPAAIPAFRGFEESSSDGVVSMMLCHTLCHKITPRCLDTYLNILIVSSLLLKIIAIRMSRRYSCLSDSKSLDAIISRVFCHLDEIYTSINNLAVFLDSRLPMCLLIFSK